MSCHKQVGAGISRGMTDHNTNTKVVVIGGGYAGTLADNRMQQNTGIDITSSTHARSSSSATAKSWNSPACSRR